MASLLEKIKALYTARREGLPDFVWDEDEVSAYASFYLPTNGAKFHFLLNQIDPELKEKLASCEVIDFGTGPGTYLVSYLEAFGGNDCGHLWGIDKDTMMLKQAEKLTHGLFPHLKKKIHLVDHLDIPRSSRERLVIFGNSCNEMSAPEIIKVLKKLSPEHVVFLEPGVPAVFDILMDLRRYFQAGDYDCAYPCPSLEKACPVQKRVEEGLEDWCHQVWRGTHEPEIEKLGQLASIDRKAMAFIGHIYTKTEKIKKDPHRFVRFMGESKHAFTWEVCRLHEGEQVLTVFEIPKKSLSKKEQKEFKKLCVGAHFDYEIIKELKESLRVSVTLETI